MARKSHGSPLTTRGYDETHTWRGRAEPADLGAYGGEPVVRDRYPAMTRNGAGTAALVLGVIGVLTSLIIIGGLLGLIAIVCGAIGLGRYNRREATNKGAAVSGIVLGVIAFLVSAAVVAAGANLWSDNKAEFNNLTDCLASANTTAEVTACQNQFKDAVTR
jgi:hypothetical protein